jgi:hypothetical protein
VGNSYLSAGLLAFTLLGVFLIRARSTPIKIACELGLLAAIAAYLMYEGTGPLPSLTVLAHRADGVWLRALAGRLVADRGARRRHRGGDRARPRRALAPGAVILGSAGGRDLPDGRAHRPQPRARSPDPGAARDLGRDRHRARPRAPEYAGRRFLGHRRRARETVPCRRSRHDRGACRGDRGRDELALDPHPDRWRGCRDHPQQHRRPQPDHQPQRADRTPRRIGRDTDALVGPLRTSDGSDQPGYPAVSRHSRTSGSRPFPSSMWGPAPRRWASPISSRPPRP